MGFKWCHCHCMSCGNRKFLERAPIFILNKMWLFSQNVQVYIRGNVWAKESFWIFLQKAWHEYWWLTFWEKISQPNQKINSNRKIPNFSLKVLNFTYSVFLRMRLTLKTWCNLCNSKDGNFSKISQHCVGFCLPQVFQELFSEILP